MAIQTKRAFYVSMFVLALSGGSAYCQTPSQPKLIVNNVTLFPQPDGFNNSSVNLGLDRGPSNPQVGFSVSIQHVRTLDEVYDKLKPAIDDLANEMKTAAEGFHPPH